MKRVMIITKDDLWIDEQGTSIEDVSLDNVKLSIPTERLNLLLYFSEKEKALKILKNRYGPDYGIKKLDDLEGNFDVIDNYTHLRFEPVKKLEELRVGEMVQVLESNSRTLRWEWHEVDEQFLVRTAKYPNTKILQSIRKPI